MNEWKNVDNWKKVMVNDGAAGGDADGDGDDGGDGGHHHDGSLTLRCTVARHQCTQTNCLTGSTRRHSALGDWRWENELKKDYIEKVSGECGVNEEDSRKLKTSSADDLLSSLLSCSIFSSSSLPNCQYINELASAAAVVVAA